MSGVDTTLLSDALLDEIEGLQKSKSKLVGENEGSEEAGKA